MNTNYTILLKIVTCLILQLSLYFTSEQAFMVGRRFAWLIDYRHFGKIITKVICVQFMMDIRFEWCADFFSCQFHPIDPFEKSMCFYFVRSCWASACFIEEEKNVIERIQCFCKNIHSH